MTALRPAKKRTGKIGIWLPLIACLLLAGTVWLGLRQYKAQQRNNCLFLALQAADPVAVRNALNAGADPNSVIAAGPTSGGYLVTLRQWLDEIMHRNLTSTALTVAVSTQNPQCVRLLLDKGANPNRPNSDGGTPLMRAASVLHYGSPQSIQPPVQQQIQIMQMLLNHGANVNAQSNQGRTAFGNSIYGGGYNLTLDLTVPRFLIAHGANVNAKCVDGQTPFEWTIADGSTSIVPLTHFLLDHGANVNEAYSNGGSPLQRATEWINPALVQTLVLHGANLNVHSPGNDMTPLIQAARQGQVGTMKLLIAKGADVNAFSVYDSSALFVATQHNRPDMVKLLLEHGANSNYVNKIEMCDPALYVAVAQHHPKLVSLLVAHGADANVQGQDGSTSLTLASKYGYNDLLPLLQPPHH